MDMENSGHFWALLFACIHIGNQILFTWYFNCPFPLMAGAQQNAHLFRWVYF